MRVWASIAITIGVLWFSHGWYYARVSGNYRLAICWALDVVRVELFDERTRPLMMMSSASYNPEPESRLPRCSLVADS